MNPLSLLSAVPAAVAAVLEVRPLPEVIDFTLIINAAGLGGLMLTTIGAALRVDHDRLGRLTLLGNALGGTLGAVAFLALVAVDVL